MNEVIYNILAYLILLAAVAYTTRNIILKLKERKQSDGCGTSCGSCGTPCELKSAMSELRSEM